MKHYKLLMMVAYDESNIYIGAICYDPTPGKRPIASLRRDFSFNGNDNFAVFFDPYNDQVDNLNVNIRFQWRFAPVSDLFIVYTSNSYTADSPYADDFSNKDRGLVMKLSYWFN